MTPSIQNVLDHSLFTPTVISYEDGFIIQYVPVTGHEPNPTVIDGVPYISVTAKPKNPVDENILKIFEKLKIKANIIFPTDEETRIMLFGFPQSGKSFVQFVLLWYSAFVLKKNTIHLLMERTDSLLQNISRDYPSFCTDVKDICDELEIPWTDYIFNYLPFPKYAINTLEKLELNPTSHLTVHVANANVPQLNHIVKLPIEYRQIVVTDEADIFIKEKGKPVMNKIDVIMHDAEKRYECTATPFSNFNIPEQFYDRVIKLEPKPEYRGYNASSTLLERHVVSDDDLEELTGILGELFAKDTGDYKNVTLINMESKNKKQTSIKNKIEAAFPGQVDVYIINSDQSNRYKHPLSKTMNEIANSEGTKPVVIISGLMASRAVSFRTSIENPKQGILTGMIYKPSKSANQTTLMQAMRIFGNYKGCPKIDAYWTADVDSAIQSSFINNNSIIKTIKPNLESRKCIENAIVIGKRKFSSNDDSHIEKVEAKEFKTRDALVNFLTHNMKRGKYPTDMVITGILKNVTVSPFTYGGQQNRTQLKDEVRFNLEKDYPECQDRNFETGRMHVAWSEVRYRELFSIKTRLEHDHYTVAAFTCGNPFKTGLQKKMPVVIWKNEYQDIKKWNDPNVVYVFPTTQNTWKVWFPSEYRKIEH